MEETLSTLKFASRAKRIEVAPIVNEVLDTTTVMQQLKREIRLLKQKLSERDLKDREKSVKELETLSRSIIATPARPRRSQQQQQEGSGIPLPSVTLSSFQTPSKPCQHVDDIELEVRSTLTHSFQ